MACEDTAKAAYQEIKAAACDADVGRALRRIRMEDLGQRRLALAKQETIRATGQNPLPDKVASTLEGMVADSVQEFKDDLAKGPGGDLCRSVVETAKDDTVRWKVPGGLIAKGIFQKYDGTWQLVQMTYEPPAP